MYEAHFGIPMAGAILNAINIRLDAKTISYIIDHSKTKIIFVDTEFLPIIKEALKIKNLKMQSSPLKMIINFHVTLRRKII